MSTNNIKSIIDPTDFSDASAGLDLYGNMIRESHHYDAFGGKTRFHARVLSVPIPMDSAGFRVDSAMGAPPAPGTAGSYLSKAIGYAFRARILDDPSPHWFIPDPCGTTEVLSSTDAQKLIMLHTKFIMAVTHVSEVPNMGDIVMVELKKDTFAYNLQLGEALYKIDSKIYQQSTLFGDSAGCGNKCPERIAPRVAPPPSAPGPSPAPVPSAPVPSPRAAYEEEAPYVPSVPRTSGAEPLAIQSMRSKGWTPLEDGTVNLVGVRYKTLPRDYTSESGLDKFVDRLQSIWFEDGKWKVLSSPATTMPGVGKRSKGYNRKWGLDDKHRSVWGTGVLGSTAVLLPGHYPRGYKWRAHSGKYLTMAQNQSIPHYRDFDFNEVVGNEAGRTIDSSHHGMQILDQDCATWKGKKCSARDIRNYNSTVASRPGQLSKYGGDTTIWEKSIGANMHASAHANTDPSPLKPPKGPSVNREKAKAYKTYPKEGPIVATPPHQYSSRKPEGPFRSMNYSSSRVNGWSAACQVFKNYADWRASIDIWSRSAQVYKQYKYPYTLFDEKDIAGGIPALDEDATHFVGV